MIGNGAANTLDGLAGVDTMNGGDGTDTYIADLATDVVTETNAVLATGGDDLVFFTGTSGTFTLGNNVERLTLLGASAINGTGNALANTLIGNDGLNVINGGGGLDTMAGGNGSDTYFADLATDKVLEIATGGNDLVNFTGSSGTFTLGNNVERLTLLGASAINGTGNALANTIVGNDGVNVINGFGGLDTMAGGNGSDTYFADLVTDVVTETNAVLATGGDDLVKFTGSSGTFTLGNNVERLTLLGAFAINGTGNTLANTLIGNGAFNLLNGKGGNDVLTGGLGSDTFRFDTALAANLDNIADFNVADDTMQLENAIFAALAATGVLAAVKFHDITTQLQDTDDVILYNRTTGNLTYDSNGLAAGGQTVFAHVTPNTALTNLDFFVT